MEIISEIERINEEIGRIQDILALAERVSSKIQNFEIEIVDPFLAFLERLYGKRDNLHKQQVKLIKDLRRSSKKKSSSHS